MRKTIVAAALAVACGMLAAAPAQGQGWGDRLKKSAEEAAKRKVAERVERRAGEGTERVLDGAENSVRCAATDTACAERQAAARQGGAAPAPAAAAPTAASPSVDAAAPGAAASVERPGTGVWLNYDFKPGERPLFVEDFARDAIGDFPRRLEFKEGNMEVVEWKGSRYLRAAGDGEFFIPLAETLPERFTIEFDYYGLNKYELKLTFNENVGSPGDQVVIGAWGSGLQGSVRAIAKMPEDIDKRMVKVRVMVDGRYAKVYVDSQRVANVPNASLGRFTKIHVDVPGTEEIPALVGNLRVMAGGRDLYDALSEKGRVATQGIYFDTGSDVLRAESTPTLKEIGAMLAEHPELRLTIEGHTDNVGAAAANKALSEKRAAAVAAYLVANHGIAADRLASAGFGDTKPAAPNATPEGRQQNRRVELVRQQ